MGTENKCPSSPPPVEWERLPSPRDDQTLDGHTNVHLPSVQAKEVEVCLLILQR